MLDQPMNEKLFSNALPKTGIGFCALLAALIIPSTQNIKITQPTMPKKDKAGTTDPIKFKTTLRIILTMAKPKDCFK